MALPTRPASVYRGDTYRIPALRGGWNTNPNVDLIPAEAMTEALNINLHRGARETRGGVAKVHATAISGAPRIMGFTQFRKRNGTTSIVTATADGKIWKDYTTLLKSGLTANKVTHLTPFNDTLYICNGADRPQTWNGTAAATSDLTNVPTDWSGSSAWPKQMVVHGRGVSRRLWAYGVPGKTEKLYTAPTGGDDFSDASVVTLSIETGDDFGVVALPEFGNRLIPIGKRRAYLVDDSDPDDANWGYEAAQWEGGVASERLVVRTPNDLLVFSEDPDVYSIIATQATGDYASVSLARPAHIHVWIKDHVDLSLVADFHAVYDPAHRACKIFVVRQDQSQVDTALVYFIDRPADEAWVRHQYYAAGIASSSAVVRVSAGDSRVYVGGHDGYLRSLEDPDTALDDGTAYRNGFTTPDLTFDDPRGLKRYDRGWLVMKQLGDESVTVNLRVDGAAIADGLQLVTSTGAELVTADADTFEASSLTDFTVTPTSPGSPKPEDYAIGIVGTRIQADVYGAVDGERFFITQKLIDHQPLGAAAA